jgi:potassium uptake TrkH family protein
VASIVVFSLIYYHGFFITHSEREVITTIIKVGLGFYMFKYLMRLVLSFRPLQDIKATIPEGVLMLLVFLNFLFAKLLGWHMIHSIGELLNLENLELFFAMVIQIYFAIILINEVGRAGNLISNLNLSPPTLLISSFLVLIIVGTGLLMLPQITVSGESMPFSDALFTSISASCVTGLVVVDTATYFTVKGQFIIMMLFQFGGLNIISFAALFALFARQSIGIKHQNIIKDSLNVDSLNASSSLFRKIFTFSITIELIGAALIFLSWGGGVEFKSLTDKAFNSLFHSISAFNNAGFSLFSNGLFEDGLRDSYALHFIVAIIIILGGIGFAVIRDVLDVKQNKKGRKRRHALKLNSKIALIGSTVLIFVGFFILYLFEHNNTMADKSTFGKITASFFQSVTSRTAGFNTVDIGALAAPSLIFLIFLMFIGASPGSTGGGIKTNTFVIVFLGAISTARGKGRLELFRNTIPFDLLNKAFLIFLFSIAFISLGIFGLAITEPDKDLLALSFEEVSAYCTVGLSTGITSDISPTGRIIIMLSMFLGRIGTLSLAFALGKKKKKVVYKYPKTNIMVG